MTTDEVRSRTMRAVKGKDTKPEMTVRRMLHASGFRYRLHAKYLPGKPDLVFPSRRKVIFVHGCWWHGHDCARGARPAKSNCHYWATKIGRNVDRDARHMVDLQSSGWKPLVVWECEIGRPDLWKRLVKFLGRNVT